MKKHTIILLSIAAVVLTVMSLCTTACKKTSGGVDSGYFYFHFHTNIADSTIGGNPGPDSNTTGSTNPWYYIYDTSGPRILLTVPQFFVSDIQLVNANGSTLSLNNVVVLKGLDSEDYYLCKVPIGTYTSAKFSVGLSGTNNALPPTSLFVTDGITYPVEASMWTGATSTGYYGMVVQGMYDTTAGHTGQNPISFNFELSNSLTSATQVALPARGSAQFPDYILTAGGTQYIHVLCDYGKLLSVINLRTSNQTSVNPLIADTLANNIPNMFRYEE